MADWPLPPNFQLVSEAKDENARLDMVYLKHNVCRMKKGHKGMASVYSRS